MAQGGGGMEGYDFSGEMGRMGDRDDEINVGLLLYGHSGAGKTALGCQPEHVLVVLLEANGKATIRAINPDARVLDVVELAQRMGVSTLDAFKEVLRQAKAGIFRDAGIRVFTLDSLQEAQRLLKDEQVLALEQSAKSRGLTGRDLLKASQPDWMNLKERTRRLCRTLRDLPHDLVCIALAKIDEERDEDGNVTSTLVRPGLEGNLHNEVMGYFSAVGYVHKVVAGKTETGQPIVEHRVLFEAPSTRLLVKGCASLPGLTHADCRKILARMHSAGDGADGLAVVVRSTDPVEEVQEKPAAQAAAGKVEAKPRQGWGKKKKGEAASEPEPEPEPDPPAKVQEKENPQTPAQADVC